MKILICPLNGPRNISEFACLGEFKVLPKDGAETTAWADFTFLESNTAGLVREWWIHIPSSYVFVVERDTLTEEIRRTLPLPAATNSSIPSIGDGEDS